MSRVRKSLLGLSAAALLSASPLWAAPDGVDPSVTVDVGGTFFAVDSGAAFEAATLSITGPKGYVLTRSFGPNAGLTADLLADAEPVLVADQAAALNNMQHAKIARDSLADGDYSYQVNFRDEAGNAWGHYGEFTVESGLANEVSQKFDTPGSKAFGGGVGPKDITDAGDIKAGSGLAAGNTAATPSVGELELHFGGVKSVEAFASDLRLEATDSSITGTMSINENGNVGINTVAPARRLQVVGPDGFDGPALMLSAAAAGTFFTLSHNTGGIGFLNFDTHDGIHKMVLTGDGNLGIGDGFGTPQTLLHVQRQNGTAAEIRSQVSGGSAVPRRSLYLINNGDPLLRLENTASASQWDFRTTSGGFSITRVGTGQLEAEVQNDGDFSIAGSYLTHSSRSVKDNIVEVDGETVLAKLESLPIAEWSYSRNLSQRHVGPMAEDFHAAFGLGPDNRHVTPTDLAGVALAAAKALKAENAKLRAEVLELKGIEARLDRLERRLRIGR